MLWRCFAAGGTGAVHKIVGIMRQENYVDILKQHLKTNLTQLHQLFREEWAKIHPTYCEKLVEGYPKHLTQAMLPNTN